MPTSPAAAGSRSPSTSSCAAPRDAMEDGFTAFKVIVGSPDPRDDVRRVAAVRRAIGPEPIVMVDAGQKWSLRTALEAIRRLRRARRVLDRGAGERRRRRCASPALRAGPDAHRDRPVLRDAARGAVVPATRARSTCSSTTSRASAASPSGGASRTWQMRLAWRSRRTSSPSCTSAWSPRRRPAAGSSTPRGSASCWSTRRCR